MAITTPRPAYPPNAAQIVHVPAFGTEWVISVTAETDDDGVVLFADLVKLGSVWFDAADVFSEPFLNTLNAELRRMVETQAKADAADDAIARHEARMAEAA